MKPLIVANWKCNPKSLFEAKKLFDSVAKKKTKNLTAVICPPFVYLPELKKNSLKLGAQNVFFEEKGAYTGEISPLMLKSIGCSYVIIGHSERRKHLKETEEIIGKKVNLSLKLGLKTILCIADLKQLKNSLKRIKLNENLILAYEPVFAIGTGKACSLSQAKRMRMAIKKELPKDIPVLYGGSVDSQNAGKYIKEAGFQGLLVGSASLKANEFSKILGNIDKA